MFLHLLLDCVGYKLRRMRNHAVGSGSTAEIVR